MKTNGTYFVNDEKQPIRYGSVNLINPARKRRKNEPGKNGIEALPVFCGFCGTDFALMKMGRMHNLHTKFPAGEQRLINGHEGVVWVPDEKRFAIVLIRGGNSFDPTRFTEEESYFEYGCDGADGIFCDKGYFHPDMLLHLPAPYNRMETGYPKEEADRLCGEIGYADKLLDTAEPYHLWVIAGDFETELPLRRAGLNVIWAEDVSAYKKMKVRILNGAHTSLVFPALLCGVETVRESLLDAALNEFLEKCLFDCILPVLGQTEENRQFAAAVLTRFANPYIRHRWQSIALNSVSKFTTRVLPTVFEFYSINRTLPKPPVFSLACLIEYYKTNAAIEDDRAATDFIRHHSVKEILSDTAIWGRDLSVLEGLVAESLDKIHTVGIREALQWALL